MLSPRLSLGVYGTCRLNNLGLNRVGTAVDITCLTRLKIRLYLTAKRGENL